LHDLSGSGVGVVTIVTPWTQVFPPIAEPVHLNVLEVVEPKKDAARMIVAAIIPKSTAYSTAVAPR
jgi:hypothetical protein